MWKLIGRPKTMQATRALAKRFSDMEPAPHDRPLSERRLQVYQRLLAEGAFRPVTWACAACAETGATYRVNGKHTSVMLSGLDKPPEFFVTIEEYEAETLEDVARLYATFDSSIQSRTARDIYLSFAGTVKELAGVAGRTIGLSVSGMSYHLNGGVGETAQAAAKAERLLEHPEFVLWLHALFSENPRGDDRGSVQHICRASVVAAAFGTWLKAKGDAGEFWRAVRDETDPKPDMPARKLARFLLATAVATGPGARQFRRASDREFYVKCLHSWNAWRKSEPTNLRYHAEAPVPGIK